MLKVPVIQSGLTQTETIVQIANVFEYLDGIVNHVFDKIGSRIEANNRRVSAIQGRIATANEQVEALKSSKKSIVICSPGKYPGRNDCEGIPSTFAEKDDKAPQLNRDFPLSCSATPLGESCLKEKLQFFHVRAKGINKGTQKLDNNSLSLGAAVPNYVSSVSDLYLHNTSELAYQQQRQRARKLDVPERREALERSPSKLENKKLDDTTMPHSILHPEDWGARQVPGDNFFYSPTINDAPDLEMPDDLPDLPGIAIDIAFGKSDERQRPTTGKQSNTGQAKSTADKIVAVQETAKEEVDNGPKRDVATAPVLPALPSFTAPQETIKCAPPTSSAPSVSSGAPAPPPPPPPPPALPPLSTAAPATTATQPTKAAVPADARSNLMDAIRKAGGKAKLRAAEPQPKEGGKQSESKPGSGSAGNLMDDLHKKLMMRRKGISGAKKPENVMDRLSALIPPPKAEANRKDGAAEDEEDWS